MPNVLYALLTFLKVFFFFFLIDVMLFFFFFLSFSCLSYGIWGNGLWMSQRQIHKPIMFARTCNKIKK